MLNWLPYTTLATVDVIAVANTYIVFTTIIFVGFTVVLGIMGYLFTQQFTASKHAQVAEALEDLQEKLRTDEYKGIKLLEALLENPDVKQHLDHLLQSKVDSLIKDKASELGASAAAAAEFAGLESLGRKVSGPHRQELSAKRVDGERLNVYHRGLNGR